MVRRLDLFRSEDDGRLSWLAPVESVAEAKELVKHLAPSFKGFCVIERETGKKTLIGPKA